MQYLNIQLEQWQQVVLEQMALERGVRVETIAQSILTERLVERINMSLNHVITGRHDDNALESPDTIEQRLRILFDE